MKDRRCAILLYSVHEHSLPSFNSQNWSQAIRSVRCTALRGRVRASNRCRTFKFIIALYFSGKSHHHDLTTFIFTITCLVLHPTIRLTFKCRRMVLPHLLHLRHLPCYSACSRRSPRHWHALYSLAARALAGRLEKETQEQRQRAGAQELGGGVYGAGGVDGRICR